jgi:hypothetical protein
MTPDRYEVSSAGRRRLSGSLQKRGSRLGLPTWGGFVLGGLFVAVGTYIILVGTKVLPVNPASVHAPYWVLTVAGVSFALGGFMVWGMTWRQFAANRRRVEAARRYPDEPALADYSWHPEGFEVSEWPGLAKAVAIALALTVFLSMFNWWAFAANGPWMVKGIVGLFDVIALLLWAHAVRQLLRALKFGHSRVEFTSFPYRLPKPVVIRWQPFGGISRVNKGTFTLRCVKEWMERSGSGKNRTVTLVHEEIWSAKWILEQPCNFQLREEVELSYELPTDAQPTQLSADKPIFWELEAKLDLPGLDFNETYLVPVYSMSEFKFSCPACGQNILCDTTHVGTQIACPGCNATIPVPKEITGPADVSTQPGILPALPGTLATTTQRTCGLAIASLVCSLSSLITCVGWLPGIICGHLAKSRIRRNPSFKGSGLATAGLIIGYLILTLEVGTATVRLWSYSTAVKQGYENVRHDLATNNFIVTQTQSTTVSNDNKPTEPVKPETVATATPQIEPAKSEWTADISKASFPDHPASGKLHGMDFAAKSTLFRNGDLKIRAGNGMLLDIFHLGASIEGSSYEIQPDDNSNTNPHVKMTWNEEGVIQTATFNKGYGMKLQFNQDINRTVSAKIYLCFPDDSKSYVAGTLKVRLPKQN